MKCPRCSAEIEYPLAQISEDGSPAACPACKAKFRIYRESFGGRAGRKTGEISCVSCGSSLGPEMHCQSCGRAFPDYVVAGQGGKGAKKKSIGVTTKSRLGKKRDRGMGDLPTLEMAMKDEPSSPKPQLKIKGSRHTNRNVIAATVVVLLAAAVAGGATYLNKKTEAEYTKNFALAAYGIQVGADRSDRACQRIAADWKKKMDAGQSAAPRLAGEEVRELSRIQDKLESVKTALAEEPKKFQSSKGKLGRLEGSYNKIRSLAVSPGTSLPAFNDSLNKADAEYKAASADFRSGLQPELMDELRSAALKFRGLRPLLK